MIDVTLVPEEVAENEAHRIGLTTAGVLEEISCKKVLTSRKFLFIIKIHIQAKHEGIQLSCDQCEYMASNLVNLTKHIQFIHEGVE